MLEVLRIRRNKYGEMREKEGEGVSERERERGKETDRQTESENYGILSNTEIVWYSFPRKVHTNFLPIINWSTLESCCIYVFRYIYIRQQIMK